MSASDAAECTCARPLLAPLLFAALVAAAILSLAIVQSARRVGVVLDSFSVEPSFTPNGDGHADKARIKFRDRRAASGVTVRVIDGDGAFVRTLDSDLRLSPRDRLYRFDWNGRTEEGQLAAPGSYRAQVLIPDGDREIDSPEQIRLLDGDGG